MLLMANSVMAAERAANLPEEPVQVVPQSQRLPHHGRTLPGEPSQQVRAAPFTTGPEAHFTIHFTRPVAVDATITRHKSALALIGGLPQDAVPSRRVLIPLRDS